MEKEIITSKQGIIIMTMFILGSTLVMGTSSEAKQDVWLASFAAMLLAVPIIFVYARLLSIFPGKNLYLILEHLFGKVIGKLLALPFIWFSFHIGALVIRNFAEFIHIVSFPLTPQYIISFFIILLCIWAVKAGIEVIGRWTSIIFPIVVIAIIVVTLMLSPLYDFSNFKPVLYNGFQPIISTAFSLVTFPFAETVIFTTVLNGLQNNKSTYKVYYWSLLIGGSTILLVAVRSLLVLGAENTEILYFASFSSVRLIDLGKFIQRIEISVTVVFLFAGFVKASICLYAASCGLAKVFNLSSYRQVVSPVGLLMLLLSGIIYHSTIEMFEWAEKIYKYYAVPFEIILPLIILIFAEIKIRTGNKKAICRQSS